MPGPLNQRREWVKATSFLSMETKMQLLTAAPPTHNIKARCPACSDSILCLTLNLEHATSFSKKTSLQQKIFNAKDHLEGSAQTSFFQTPWHSYLNKKRRTHDYRTHLQSYKLKVWRAVCALQCHCVPGSLYFPKSIYDALALTAFSERRVGVWHRTVAEASASAASLEGWDVERRTQRR